MAVEEEQAGAVGSRLRHTATLVGATDGSTGVGPPRWSGGRRRVRGPWPGPGACERRWARTWPTDRWLRVPTRAAAGGSTGIFARSAGTVAARITATWLRPSRAMNRLASRSLTDGRRDDVAGLLLLGPGQRASISARPTPWRRHVVADVQVQDVDRGAGLQRRQRRPDQVHDAGDLALELGHEEPLVGVERDRGDGGRRLARVVPPRRRSVRRPRRAARAARRRRRARRRGRGPDSGTRGTSSQPGSPDDAGDHGPRTRGRSGAAGPRDSTNRTEVRDYAYNGRIGSGTPRVREEARCSPESARS